MQCSLLKVSKKSEEVFQLIVVKQVTCEIIQFWVDQQPNDQVTLVYMCKREGSKNKSNKEQLMTTKSNSTFRGGDLRLIRNIVHDREMENEPNLP
jgi:hypothetical protein